MNLRTTITGAALGAVMAASAAFSGAVAADDTIKVGILHSLSGTMAISETTLKDAMLMLIDEQNKKGGLLGKKLEAVVVDPASDWPLFAEKARELIQKDKVAASSVAGRPRRASPFCRFSKRPIRSSSTRSSMKAKSPRATSSTPVLLRTSRPFLLSTT